MPLGTPKEGTVMHRATEHRRVGGGGGDQRKTKTSPNHDENVEKKKVKGLGL